MCFFTCKVSCWNLHLSNLCSSYVMLFQYYCIVILYNSMLYYMHLIYLGESSFCIKKINHNIVVTSAVLPDINFSRGNVLCQQSHINIIIIFTIFTIRRVVCESNMEIFSSHKSHRIIGSLDNTLPDAQVRIRIWYNSFEIHKMTLKWIIMSTDKTQAW